MPKQKALRICDVCGASFHPRGIQKRCTNQCMVAAEKKVNSDRHKKMRSDVNWRQKKAAYLEEWKAKNQDKRKSYARQRAKKLAKQTRAYFAVYRIANRDKLKMNHYRWRQRNKDKIAANSKQWRTSERGRTKTNENTKRRELTDPGFLMTRRIRARIKIALQKAGTKKARKTLEYLGMSGREFMDYLLRHPSNDGRFNASNYGTEWVVDHIRPIASFDLTDEQQLKQAFYYSNCQPMDPAENLTKGCYWNGLHWRNGVGQKMPWCCEQDG